MNVTTPDPRLAKARAATTRSRKPPLLGKVTWAIVGTDGVEIRELPYGAGATLGVAQRLAELAPDPISYTVERRDLFGPAAALYRVARDEDGTVATTILSEED